MTSPNVDPAAIPDRPIPSGTPAGQAQEHPPIWDARGKRWDYVPEFQPTYGYPPPHPPVLSAEPL